MSNHFYSYPYHANISAFEGGYDRIVLTNTVPNDTVYVEGRVLLDGDRLRSNWGSLSAADGVIQLNNRNVTYGMFRVWVNYYESGAWVSKNSPTKEYYNPVPGNAGTLEIDVQTLKPHKIVTFDNTASQFPWDEKIMWMLPTCPNSICEERTVEYGKKSTWNLDNGSIKGGFFGGKDGILLARKDWGGTISVIFLSGGSTMTPANFMGKLSYTPLAGIFTFSPQQFAYLSRSGKIFDLLTGRHYPTDYSRLGLPPGFQPEEIPFPPQPQPLPEQPEYLQEIYALLGLQNTINPTDWDILGIPEGSDPATIRKAYFNRAKQWHPDKNPDPRATEVFKVIDDAYRRLI